MSKETLTQRILREYSRNIPTRIRRIILSEKMIDDANPLIDDEDTPMEFLFEVFNEFVDKSGTYNDFYCSHCREYIHKTFQKMKPYIEMLENV